MTREDLRQRNVDKGIHIANSNTDLDGKSSQQQVELIRQAESNA